MNAQCGTTTALTSNVLPPSSLPFPPSLSPGLKVGDVTLVSRRPELWPLLLHPLPPTWPRLGNSSTYDSKRFIHYSTSKSMHWGALQEYALGCTRYPTTVVWKLATLTVWLGHPLELFSGLLVVTINGTWNPYLSEMCYHVFSLNCLVVHPLKSNYSEHMKIGANFGTDSSVWTAVL